ncbi:23S rRNA (uracil(1939)-C(5))-methyltransferase RlmD [Vibrio sp. HA2012]|uniref:23S rRNA (uracil(1939)-C(5))-methyltransferase RlmD n=1 Tax=Vibrio sp. HA2012 TaxID=1971595 RepID=UPI000C2C02BF|nr:23S rRNA (uracil(1939)-C(5))-methyltransferase RlmD [Vibrio sp. HA2012]PJC86339.1 23S rRNA (uracil(1939)-C(5))-methyltransferase RlmD [Vibrio sp. HA2012]
MARFYQPKKKAAPATKHQAIMIEKLDHQGAGIGYLNRKPVFVEGALPGEEVLIQLTEDKSKYARGTLIRQLSVSEHRVTPFCPHYSECGGCNMQHLSYVEQLKHKQASLSQLMKKFAGEQTEPEATITGPQTGYRRRARFSLLKDKKTAALRFGFRKKQSKQIVNIDQCPVLAPELNALLPELKRVLSGFKHQEQLGHAELVLGDNTPVVLLRILKPLVAADQQAITDFAGRHHLALYLQVADSAPERITGETACYTETGLRIPFLPTNFIQVNRSVNQQMVAQALEWLDVQPDEQVLDLFCGLGNFSLPLAQQAAQVVGVEGVQEMVTQAADNAASNGLHNTAFYQADLEQALAGQAWAETRFEKVLLDPARAGAAGVVEQLAGLGAKRVVYVSCNPATLARDSQCLLQQGYKLQKMGMLDMFPHTSHLESMALFVK